MNKVFLIGNLTRDVELRTTGGGTQVGNIGIAVNRKYTASNGEKREEVYFADCVAFGATAENAAKYIGKGSKVAIEGRLKNDEWEDKQTGKKMRATRIIIDQLQFLDSRGQRENDAPRPNMDSGTKSKGGTASYTGDDDGGIPF